MLPAYGAGPYLPAIVLERPVYIREMADGLYSPLAYLLYKVGPTAEAVDRPQAYRDHCMLLTGVGGARDASTRCVSACPAGSCSTVAAAGSVSVWKLLAQSAAARNGWQAVHGP